MERDTAFAGLGARLRSIRESRRMTLATVSEASGISISTLSRLESGSRRPHLDLLLPLARVYRLTLDDLVDAPALGDPRIRPRPRVRDGVVTVPLSGGDRARGKPSSRCIRPLRMRTSVSGCIPGWDWIYVISGRMRLLLADDDLIVEAGDAVEFDTRVPHGFSNPGPGVLEVLCLFNAAGARLHTRAVGEDDPLVSG